MSINNKTLKAKIPYEFKIKKQANSNNLTLEQAWSDENTFTKKAGLECNGSNDECSVSSADPKLNVKVGTQKKEGITSVGTETGKIKMEKDKEGYRQGLKFTISGADVSLTGGTGADAITKLEELETYEITEEGGKYYLTRKTTKEENIRSSLVLPKECELPTTNESKTCSLKQDAFKAINFESKGTSEISSTGDVSLTISKASNTTDFPLGYKFTFNTTSDATVSSTNKIKANIPTDFKIKKNQSTPTTLTLEKAWDDAKFSFAGKVGLECNTSGTDGCCTKSSGSVKLNVKKGNDVKTEIDTVTTSSSKIKVEKDQAGYNQGLKFTISGGDVTLSGGTTKSGSSDITKLEELETYEITEEGGKYYLTRKDEASKTIETQLGLPTSCKLSTTGSCSLTTEDLKKVNFDGKDTSGASMTSGTASLTITKQEKKDDYPLGYKFSLQSQQDITIKSNTNTVKKNTPYDFKIKKDTTTPTNLSLEKAWTAESLGKKVGLNCTTSGTGGTECCSMASGSSEKLNVMQGSDKKDGITGFNGSSGKIKVTKDQEGYNQGLKFTISDADVTLTGGSKSSGSSEDITKLEEYETYEIKEVGGKWYLARKHESIVFLKKELGLEFCTKETFGRTYTCDIEEVSKLKGIKFHNMGGHTNWPTGAINLQLAIERETSPATGLKFTFNDNDSDSSGGSLCIPDGKGGSLDLKSGTYKTSGPEYKIKKCNNSGTLSLTLEKKDSGSSSSCSK